MGGSREASKRIFAAKEVPGTPPKKLNSDLGPKMEGEPGFVGRFGGLRTVSGGGVFNPGLGSFLKSLFKRSLQMRIAMELGLEIEIGNGDWHWRLSLETFV